MIAAARLAAERRATIAIVTCHRRFRSSSSCKASIPEDERRREIASWTTRRAFVEGYGVNAVTRLARARGARSRRSSTR